MFVLLSLGIGGLHRAGRERVCVELPGDAPSRSGVAFVKARQRQSVVRGWGEAGVMFDGFAGGARHGHGTAGSLGGVSAPLEPRAMGWQVGPSIRWMGPAIPWVGSSIPWVDPTVLWAGSSIPWVGSSIPQAGPSIPWVGRFLHPMDGSVHPLVRSLHPMSGSLHPMGWFLHPNA